MKILEAIKNLLFKGEAVQSQETGKFENDRHLHGGFMNQAEIWGALTGPNSQPLWNVFAALAAALGHPEGAKTIQLLGAAAPVIGQSLPAHPDATK